MYYIYTPGVYEKDQNRVQKVQKVVFKYGDLTDAIIDNRLYQTFNIELIDSKNIIKGVKQIFQYLISHPEMRRVVYCTTKWSETSFKEDHLLHIVSLNGSPIRDYIAGPRDLFLELAGAYLIEIQHRILMHDNFDYDVLFIEVLKQKFQHRYVLH